MSNRRFSRVDAAKVVLVMLLATALGILFASLGFPETNIVLVYLAAVLLIARYTHGPGYALAASVLATFAFNYFFTDPRFTFEVSDTSYLITFAIMTFTAIFTSTLTAQIKRSARQALARERDTQALYQLTNRLSDAQSMEKIGTAALGSIGQTFGCDAALLFLTEKGEAERSYLQVGSALAQMERRAPDREIDAELPEELMLVPMDAKLIVQMLVNLLDNAVRHTPQGNEIKVCVEKRDGKAVFSVLDRGEGIREEDLPHLFERFYTTRGKCADAARSVGLGLSICDAIARAHGGSIMAQSREGGGAIFTFELPMEEEKQ